MSRRDISIVEVTFIRTSYILSEVLASWNAVKNLLLSITSIKHKDKCTIPCHKTTKLTYKKHNIWYSCTVSSWLHHHLPQRIWGVRGRVRRCIGTSCPPKRPTKRHPSQERMVWPGVPSHHELATTFSQCGIGFGCGIQSWSRQKTEKYRQTTQELTVLMWGDGWWWGWQCGVVGGVMGECSGY